MIIEAGHLSKGEMCNFILEAKNKNRVAPSRCPEEKTLEKDMFSSRQIKEGNKIKTQTYQNDIFSFIVLWTKIDTSFRIFFLLNAYNLFMCHVLSTRIFLSGEQEHPTHRPFSSPDKVMLDC